MNGHDNKPALLAALDKIPYPGGTTHTELGLNFIRNNAFTKAHGDRDGVNNILIVITDGASTLPDKTKLEADAIHQSNINIFAIGVGNNVKMSELEMIASDKQNVFTVDNFDALNNIQHQLQQTTCEGTCYYNKTGKNYKEGERWTDGCDKNCLCVDGNAGHYICNDVCKKNVCPNGFQCSEYPDPNMPCCTLLKVDQPALPKNCPVYTTAQFNLTKFPAGCQPFSYNPPPVMPVLNATKAPIDCGQLPADIHFLLDNSGSVGGSDFTKQLEFVKKFANSFDIGPNNVQIGVTLFSNGVTNEFWMNDHNTKQKLINAIDRIIYTGGTTRTDLGLKYIRNNAFTAAHGDRPGVNNILIVTTDGKSTNPQSTKTEANLIHKENMNIFAVGVGQNVDRNELETIATDPQNVFTVNNFNALDSIQSQLQQSSCEGYCFFNKTNTKYKEGQRWNDGCDKNCLCVDGTSGKYECNDVCKKMTCPAGSKCSEVDDPNYSCCKLLRVDEQPTPDPACFTPPPTAPPTTPKPQIVCEPQSYVAPPVMPVGYTFKTKRLWTKQS
jgi:collagen type VI alpha